MSTSSVDKKTYLIRRLACEAKSTLEVAAATRRHVKQARRCHHVNLA